MASYEASSLMGPAFHRFPALPPELRLRIWHFALQTPQLITLRLASSSDDSKRPRTGYIYANPTVRPLLLVNVEARKAALSTYLPGFFDESCKRVVWINPKLDTLHLKQVPLFLFGKYEIAKHIERIALEVEEWEWFEEAHLSAYILQKIKFLCDKVTALKEVQMVAWHERNWPEATRGMFQFWRPCAPREETWNQVYRPIALASMRKRQETIEKFRNCMEQMRLGTAFRQAQSPITVRPIAIGPSGVELSWDHESELLARYRSCVVEFEVVPPYSGV